MVAFKSIPFCDDSSGKQSLFSDEVQVEEGKGEAAGSDLEEHVHTSEAVAANDTVPGEKVEAWPWLEVPREAMSG